MDGFITRVGGQFMAADPDGRGMRPVAECLRTSCGSDFEKLVRSGTDRGGTGVAVRYDPNAMGIYEKHDAFWRDRELRILFPPGGGEGAYWTPARVVWWEENTMGPLDTEIKWYLHVQLTGPPPAEATDEQEEGKEDLPVGAVAELHGLQSALSQHNGKRVIIMEKMVGASDEYRVQYGRDEGGAAYLTVHQTNLKAYEGPFQFQVNRINVEGGGTLTLDEMEVGGISRQTRLSFEWLEPPPGDPSIKKWYFAVPSDGNDKPIDPEELARLRDGTYDDLERLLEQDGVDALQQFGEGVIRDFLAAVVVAGNNEEEEAGAETETVDEDGLSEMRKILLRLPFQHAYEIALNLLERDELEGQHLAVEALCESLEELRKDTAWYVRCYLLESRHRETPNRDRVRGLTPEQALTEYPWGDDEMESLLDTVLAHLHREAGQWYGERKEFRAAIAHFKRQLDCLEKAPSHASWSPDEKLVKVARACCDLGWACNRLGAVDLASKYYDASLTMHTAGSDRQQSKARLQEEMMEWIGTSGTVTPWQQQPRTSQTAGTDNSYKYVPPRVCAGCADATTKLCGGCQLVCFCSKECQQSNWKAHKRICRSRRI